MRETKFRAYKPHHSLGQEPGIYQVSDIVWYDDPVTDQTEEEPRVISGEVFYKGYVASDYLEDIQLIQYTGLKDKNGKEIYDGDIITIKHPHKNREHTGTVVYDRYAYTVEGFYFTHFDTPSDIFSEGTDYIEVIGNIYENPELLEKNNG